MRGQREARFIVDLAGCGLSVTDLEYLDNNYDVAIVNKIIATAIQEKERNRLQKKLDMMQAVLIGSIGARPSKRGENSRTYRREEKRILRRIRKLNGTKEPTLWEKWKRKSRRF